MNAKQIWQSALERIRPKISPATFTTWFTGTSGFSLKGHLLTVQVENTFSRAHLESRFHDLIYSVLSDLVGSDVEVRYLVGKPEEEPDTLANGVALCTIVEAIQEALPEEALEEADAEEGVRQPRQPALMTAAAARRERFEVAQEGRRLPRRALSYAGPELLPITDVPAVVSTPLLTRVVPISDGHESEAVAVGPHEWSAGEEHAATVVESVARPLEIVPPAEEPPAETPRAERPAALVPWPKTLSARGSGSVESSGGTGQVASSEGVFNPRYTFSTFIVGRSNQLAHAGSQGVADAMHGGESYNPLVLYGGVGLGKTHLLHAIGHCGLAAGLNVLYTTSDRFTNEIINAIRFHTTEEFRAKYRQIDILMVDDIQFIAGKESTEEEFFHTFNALHNANKQIVLTSDRPPKAMVTLQDRLRSRFEWGLLADIKLPEYEHRLAILRSKSEFFAGPDGLQLEIPDSVIEYIAHPEGTNVRELEGNLNRVVAYAKLKDSPVTLPIAVEALQRLLTDSHRRILVPAQVLEVVARHYNVTLEAMCGKQRDREIAWPRQVAMFMMREETKATNMQIAAELGGRDHSTVIYGANRVKEAIDNNEHIRKELAIVREELRILALQQETFDE